MNLHRLFLVAAFAIATTSSSVHAHTSLLTPASREGGKETFADETNVVGCPKPGPGPVTSVRAGDWIPVEYFRNNHVGGFIRWSIIKKGTPETKANFDTNTFFYTCRESGADCKPRNGHAYSLYGAVDDGVDNFIIKCGDKIQVPKYLDDGEYVLQFTNFATGHNFNNPGHAIPTYRSCADLKITGGSSKANAKPPCPAFVGGDRATLNEGKPADTCVYFRSNDIPTSVYIEKDPANIPQLYKFGKPAEVEKCLGAATTAGEATNATQRSYSFNKLKKPTK